MQQYASQSQSLCLSARERIGVCVSLEIQIDDLQHFIAAFASLDTVNAIGGGKEFEILNDRHVVVNTEEVRHVTDQATDLLGCV